MCVSVGKYFLCLLSLFLFLFGFLCFVYFFPEKIMLKKETSLDYFITDYFTIKMIMK